MNGYARDQAVVCLEECQLLDCVKSLANASTVQRESKRKRTIDLAAGVMHLLVNLDHEAEEVCQLWGEAESPLPCRLALW